MIISNTPRIILNQRLVLMYRKKALIQVLEKIVFPDVLEKYWEVVYKHREEGSLWNENSIFFDSFKLWGKQETKTTGEGGLICLIPNSVIFWDVITGIYALKVPEFENSSILASRALYRNLHKFLKEHGVEGEFFKNFGVNQLDYIQNPSDFNLFLLKPFVCVSGLKIQLAMQHNPRPLDKESSDKWLKMIPVWEKEVYDDTMKKFLDLRTTPPFLQEPEFHYLEESFLTLEEFSKISREHFYYGAERLAEEVHQHSDPGVSGSDDRVDDRTVD